MITREQVADLREGDVVELGFSNGAVVRGPLSEDRHTGGLEIAEAGWSVRQSDGELPYGLERIAESLTVVSRAPRPLYVNHPRTEPVPGDVVRFECDDHPGDSYTNAFLPQSERDKKPWVSLTHDPGERYSSEDAQAGHLDGWTTRLLVDGETGQVVP